MSQEVPVCGILFDPAASPIFLGGVEIAEGTIYAD
jgi:hypothetical protein